MIDYGLPELPSNYRYKLDYKWVKDYHSFLRDKDRWVLLIQKKFLWWWETKYDIVLILDPEFGDKFRDELIEKSKPYVEIIHEEENGKNTAKDYKGVIK